MTVGQILKGIGGRAPVEIRCAEPNTGRIQKNAKVLSSKDPATLNMDAGTTYVENINGKDTIIIGAVTKAQTAVGEISRFNSDAKTIDLMNVEEVARYLMSVNGDFYEYESLRAKDDGRDLGAYNIAYDDADIIRSEVRRAVEGEEQLGYAERKRDRLSIFEYDIDLETINKSTTSSSGKTILAIIYSKDDIGDDDVQGYQNAVFLDYANDKGYEFGVGIDFDEDTNSWSYGKYGFESYQDAIAYASMHGIAGRYYINEYHDTSDILRELRNGEYTMKSVTNEYGDEEGLDEKGFVRFPYNRYNADQMDFIHGLDYGNYLYTATGNRDEAISQLVDLFGDGDMSTLGEIADELVDIYERKMDKMEKHGGSYDEALESNPTFVGYRFEFVEGGSDDYPEVVSALNSGKIMSRDEMAGMLRLGQSQFVPRGGGYDKVFIESVFDIGGTLTPSPNYKMYFGEGEDAENYFLRHAPRWEDYLSMNKADSMSEVMADYYRQWGEKEGLSGEALEQYVAERTMSDEEVEAFLTRKGKMKKNEELIEEYGNYDIYELIAEETGKIYYEIVSPNGEHEEYADTLNEAKELIDYWMSLNKSVQPNTYNPASTNPFHAYCMCARAQKDSGRKGMTRDAIWKVIGTNPDRMLTDYSKKLRKVGSSNGTVYIFDEKVLRGV